jgi:multidrug transporter EmrE-like cation transporter
MTTRIVIYLVIFWLMQVAAQMFFKWGSGGESRWIWGFLGGNLFGFSSIWLLMLMYKDMNPNIALGIATGGALLLSQVAITLTFNSKVTPMQYAGIAAIVIGMIALTTPSFPGRADLAKRVTEPLRRNAGEPAKDRVEIGETVEAGF